MAKIILNLLLFYLTSWEVSANSPLKETRIVTYVTKDYLDDHQEVVKHSQSAINGIKTITFHWRLIVSKECLVEQKTAAEILESAQITSIYLIEHCYISHKGGNFYLQLVNTQKMN